VARAHFLLGRRTQRIGAREPWPREPFILHTAPNTITIDSHFCDIKASRWKGCAMDSWDDGPIPQTDRPSSDSGRTLAWRVWTRGSYKVGKQRFLRVYIDKPEASATRIAKPSTISSA